MKTLFTLAVLSCAVFAVQRIQKIKMEDFSINYYGSPYHAE
jgi:hypothetical protein